MDSTSDHVLMFATIILSLFFLSPSSTEAAAPPNPPPTFVQSLCDKVNQTFCMEALQSDPRTASASNSLTLAKIVLDIAATSTIASRKYIDYKLKSNYANPAIKPALQCCFDYYGDVVDSFTGAYKELDVDYMSANYDVFVAMDYIGVCERNLNSFGFNDTSILARNKIVKDFILMGYEVTKDLPQ